MNAPLQASVPPLAKAETMVPIGQLPAELREHYEAALPEEVVTHLREVGRLMDEEWKSRGLICYVLKNFSKVSKQPSNISRAKFRAYVTNQYELRRQQAELRYELLNTVRASEQI